MGDKKRRETDRGRRRAVLQAYSAALADDTIPEGTLSRLSPLFVTAVTTPTWA
jgi:hypothetical protein